jgi:P4 family phage/plasmid primase-like protien
MRHSMFIVPDSQPDFNHQPGGNDCWGPSIPPPEGDAGPDADQPRYMQDFLDYFPDRRRKPTGWDACCPAEGHGDDGDDEYPSLRISVGENGKIVLNCRVGCKLDGILEAVDCPMSALFCPRGQEPAEQLTLGGVAAPTDEETQRRADVYAGLLQELALQDNDCDRLEARGLNTETIHRAEYRSVPPLSLSQAVERLCEKFDPDDLLCVPGFAKDGTRVRVARHFSGAFVIPIRDASKRVVGLKTRRRDGDSPKYMAWSSPGISCGVLPHVPVHDRHAITSYDEVRVVEGELAADYLTQETELLTVSCAGTGNWPRSLSALQDVRRCFGGVTKVLVAPDWPDVLAKPAVREGVVTFLKILHSSGYEVAVEYWSDGQEKEGPDDARRLGREILTARGCEEIQTLFGGKIFDTGEDGDAGPEGVKEGPKDYHRLARVCLKSLGEVQFWKGSWMRWNGAPYWEMSKIDMHATVTSLVREELIRVHKDQVAQIEKRYETDSAAAKQLGRAAPSRPNTPCVDQVNVELVGNVMNAMKSITLLNASISNGSWLKDGGGEKRNILAVKNGLVDVDRWLAGVSSPLVPQTPEWFSPVALSYDYNPHATCPTFLEILNHALESDQQRIDFMQEWFGYNTIYDVSMETMVALVGDGGNGKSVVLTVFKEMLGAKNISAVELESLCDPDCLLETLGKLANIVTEVSPLAKAAEGKLKMMVSGEEMTYKRKYKEAITDKPTARLTLSTNTVPHFYDKTEGIWRRLVVMPFRVTIKDDEKKHYLRTPEWWRESGELPGVLNWALEGLRRWKERGRFTASKICEEEKAGHRLDANPAGAFLAENYVEVVGGHTAVLADELYKFYRESCHRNGHEHLLTKNKFGAEVARAFPVVKEVLRKSSDNRATKKVRTDKGRKPAYLDLRFIGDATGFSHLNMEEFMVGGKDQE